MADSDLTSIINSNIKKTNFQRVLKLCLSGLFLWRVNVKKCKIIQTSQYIKLSLKMYKKYILEHFKPFLNNFLSQKMTAYRVYYSSSHVLIRLIEHWKKALDENFVADTVRTWALSKQFCRPPFFMKDCVLQVGHNLICSSMVTLASGCSR